MLRYLQSLVGSYGVEVEESSLVQVKPWMPTNPTVPDEARYQWVLLRRSILYARVYFANGGDTHLAALGHHRIVDIILKGSGPE